LIAKTPDAARTRIGVDVREWRSGTRTGIGRVLSSFLEGATQNTEHEFLLFGNQYTDFRVTSERVDTRIVHETSRLAWDQIALPRLLKKTGTEVFLSPYYKGPLRAPCPVVVTANDLIGLHFPPKGIVRRHLLPLWMRMMLQSASHILTLSEYSRQDIAATLRSPFRASPPFHWPWTTGSCVGHPHRKRGACGSATTYLIVTCCM